MRRQKRTLYYKLVAKIYRDMCRINEKNARSTKRELRKIELRLTKVKPL